MPEISVTVRLSDAQQAFIRKIKWNGTRQGEILEQIKDALERTRPQMAECARCGQLLALANGILPIHYRSPSSANYCAASDTRGYLAPGCTCRERVSSCYCGAAARMAR